VKGITSLSCRVDELMHKCYPREAELLSRTVSWSMEQSLGEKAHARSKKVITELFPMSSLFTTAAVNFDATLNTHLDRKDCAYGMIVVLGEKSFHGGAFLAHQLKLRIQVAPGDVLIFRSSDIHHGVEQLKRSSARAVSGQRFSLAYYTDQSAINRYHQHLC
jgi:hypothetical protein